MRIWIRHIIDDVFLFDPYKLNISPHTQLFLSLIWVEGYDGKPISVRSAWEISHG